jgi:broad specificity phosphatase PhoE
MLCSAIVASSLLIAPVEVSLNELSFLEVSNSETIYIYLVRHGESAFNQPDSNGIKYTSGISLSVPLTITGREQATLVGEKLKSKFPYDAPLMILSSTAFRAQETADLIFTELSNQHMIERGGSYSGLCELGQGEWEGKPKDAKYEDALGIWEDLSAKDKMTFPKISTGESYAEVGERFINDLSKIVNHHPNKTLIITSHYAAMNAISLRLSGIENELSEEPVTKLPNISLHNCDIIQIKLLHDKPVATAKVQAHIKSGLKK